jgi:hypothetical protein
MDYGRIRNLPDPTEQNVAATFSNSKSVEFVNILTTVCLQHRSSRNQRHIDADRKS